jgi:hypothetical protein
MSPGSHNHRGVVGSSGALLPRAQDAQGSFIMPTNFRIHKQIPQLPKTAHRPALGLPLSAAGQYDQSITPHRCGFRP